jgi:hypothetical protein
MDNYAAEFETFWQRFPRHVGKLAAYKAYKKARALATAEQIRDGVERYRVGKPPYADWCHATTFLNQGRWDDEYDTPANGNGNGSRHTRDWCEHVPRCHNPHWHKVVVARERGEA